VSSEKMSDVTRRELLEVLEALMTEHPDWRIGQLVANIAFLACQTNSAIWDVENEQFLQAARQHLQRMAERSKAKAETKELTEAMRRKVAA